MDCRRETEVRGFWEEVRRWPAFWRVFWRVRSWEGEAGVVAEMVLEGEVETASSEAGVLVGMVGREGGELWKEFLRIPGELLVNGGGGRQRLAEELTLGPILA